MQENLRGMKRPQASVSSDFANQLNKTSHLQNFGFGASGETHGIAHILRERGIQLSCVRVPSTSCGLLFKLLSALFLTFQKVFQFFMCISFVL